MGFLVVPLRQLTGESQFVVIIEAGFAALSSGFLKRNLS
jgi:hypothetical protein